MHYKKVFYMIIESIILCSSHSSTSKMTGLCRIEMTILKNHFMCSKEQKIHNLGCRERKKKSDTKAFKCCSRKQQLQHFFCQCSSETPDKTLKAKLHTTENYLKRPYSIFKFANTTTVDYNSPVLFTQRIQWSWRETIHYISIVNLPATLPDLVEVLELMLDKQTNQLPLDQSSRILLKGNAPIPPLLQIIHSHFHTQL